MRPLAPVLLALFLTLPIPVQGAGGLARAMHPQPPGVVALTPKLFMDDPSKGAQAQRDLAAARRDVARFFGRERGDPRIILCTQAPCYRRFLGADGPIGKTWGYHLVILGKAGVSRLTMAHELTHVELHRIMGKRMRRLPAWFDEGMAGYVSRDTRLPPSTAADRARITTTRTPAAWRRAVREMGWKRAYGAARDVVANAAAQVGEAALLGLVRDLARGGDFNHHWRRMLADG